MTRTWMENYPLQVVQRIAAGGPDIHPGGQRVALVELATRGVTNDAPEEAAQLSLDIGEEADCDR